jgi:hypothetical protein
MVNLAQPDEGGEACPPPFTLYIIVSKVVVYAPMLQLSRQKHSTHFYSTLFSSVCMTMSMVGRKVTEENNQRIWTRQPIVKGVGEGVSHLSLLTAQIYPEAEFFNLLRSPGIDSQPGGIDSWAP